MADSKLVAHNDMCKTNTFLSLLVGILVLVQLRVNRAELQMQTTFKFELVNAS